MMQAKKVLDWCVIEVTLTQTKTPTPAQAVLGLSFHSHVIEAGRLLEHGVEELGLSDEDAVKVMASVITKFDDFNRKKLLEELRKNVCFDCGDVTNGATCHCMNDD